MQNRKCCIPQSLPDEGGKFAFRLQKVYISLVEWLVYKHNGIIAWQWDPNSKLESSDIQKFSINSVEII